MVKALRTGVRIGMRLAVGAAVVGAAVVLLGQDATPAKASHTKIVISLSPTQIIKASGALYIPDGDPNNDDQTTFYVWAQDVDDPQGLGAYQVEFSYISWLVGVTSFTVPDTSSNWLFSTNRSGPCLPSPPLVEEDLQTGSGHAQAGCSTLGSAPPYGPQGDGLLATFTINPGPTITAHVMNFSDDSFLLDTGDTQGGIVEPAVIPAAISNFTVFVAPCGDFSSITPGVPDGQVTIIDVLYEASKFGEIGPTYDMDGNNQVAIADILIVAREFGRFC